MKLQSIRITYLIFIVLTLFSCSEEEQLKVRQKLDFYNQDDVVVIDGIVHFKNRETFKTTIDVLHKNGRGRLKEWETKVGFYDSFRKLNDNDTINEPYPNNAIIQDPFFATVVNEDGLFVIADSIHKITFQSEYIIPDYDFELLKEIKNTDGLKSVKLKNEIIKFEITRGKADPLTKSVTWWNTREKYSPCGICHLSAHVKCWCVNYAAYSSVGIRISGRKANDITNCSDFRNDRMWLAEVDGCAWARPGNFPPEYLGTYCGSSINDDEYNVDKTLLYQVGTSIYCEKIEANYYYSDDGICINEHWFEVWN